MNTDKEFIGLLTSGGDERIIFPEDQCFNKYHYNPMDFSGLLNRGSCTSGSLNPETYAVLKKIQISHFEENFDKAVHNHAKQLKSLFHLPGKPDFEVFFAPSGSDLIYYPLLFSRLLYPDSNPVNVLTCSEELGTGSQIGAHGKYFCLLNQFGEPVAEGSNISKHIRPKVITLPARDQGGHIIDNRLKLKQIINCYHDTPKIVNLVFGSKSGIEDNLKIIDEIKRTDVLWTVDLCQFRNKKDLVNDLLSKEVILLITGSKFYQSPPFCGALLVPKKICNRLANCNPAPAKDFNNLFSSYDISECLSSIRNQLPQYKNIGLHLRWECALYEMKEYNRIKEEKTLSVILKWNELINKTLKCSEYLDPMPDMELTNKSIISFRVMHNGHYFDNDELNSLFIKIVTKKYPELDGYNKIYIGQPVKYEIGSFLRLSIGSYDVRQYAKNNNFHFENDVKTIQIIENEVKNFKKDYTR
jgi:hypothetical protein